MGTKGQHILPKHLVPVPIVMRIETAIHRNQTISPAQHFTFKWDKEIAGVSQSSLLCKRNVLQQKNRCVSRPAFILSFGGESEPCSSLFFYEQNKLKHLYPHPKPQIAYKQIFVLFKTKKYCFVSCKPDFSPEVHSSIFKCQWPLFLTLVIPF